MELGNGQRDLRRGDDNEDWIELTRHQDDNEGRILNGFPTSGTGLIRTVLQLQSLLNVCMYAQVIYHQIATLLSLPVDLILETRLERVEPWKRGTESWHWTLIDQLSTMWSACACLRGCGESWTSYINLFQHEPVILLGALKRSIDKFNHC